MYVQEEERLKLKRPKSAHLVSQDNGNVKKSKMALKVKKHRNMSIKQHGNNNKCFFYKKWGHVKKDCFKYKKWLIKKSKLISLLSHESFFIKALSNNWWICSSFTIHIVNVIQGFLILRKPKGNERGIYSTTGCALKLKLWGLLD
jgi:hypothetical protein